MPLRFLHISDIHFRKYASDKKQLLDLDANIQNEVELDLRSFCKANGPVNAILICGDIAFSGQSGEYESADDWLKKISKIVGCEQESILTVPGNHDVDRNQIRGILSNTHNQFKLLKKRKQIDPLLFKVLETNSDSEFLLKPFDNYNKFATKYGSIPSKGNVLYWEKDFDIGNFKIRIRGVNSALISNEDDDEHNSKLFLGSHQTNITREPNVINIFMCHHPPQWLYDQDEMEIEVLARSSIQLYGHKHKEGSKRIDNCLVLAAGAMQPSRKEDNWLPCFNIIELDTLWRTNENHLLVKVWKRVLDKDKTLKFIPKFTTTGSEFESHEIALGKDNEGLGPFDSSSSRGSELKNKPEEKDEMVVEVEVIDVNTPDPIRKLAYMFLSLPYHKKLRIAVGLDLYAESDQNLSDLKKSQLYFKRAKDKKKLKELWERTVETNPETMNLPNPF